jgi:hypothetical protein
MVTLEMMEAAAQRRAQQPQDATNCCNLGELLHQCYCDTKPVLKDSTGFQWCSLSEGYRTDYERTASAFMTALQSRGII